MVFHAARRRHALDTEYEGLVFGRLDLTTGAVHYVGRMGIRDEDSQPLVVDWRAPAAAAFYRATAGRPAGRGPPPDDPVDPGAGHQHRGRPARPGGGAAPRCGWSATARCWPASSKATGRGMRDIVATIQREQDEAIRSPASGCDDRDRRTGHRQDRRGAAPGGVPAVLRPQPVRRRRHPGGRPVRGVRRLHRDRAALARRGHRDAALARHAGAGLRRRPGSTRPTVAAIKGSLRMRRVLERASHDAVPDAPTELRLLYRGALLRLDAADLERIRRKALPRGARRNEVRGAGFDRHLRRAVGAGPAATVTDLPEKRDFEAELADRSDFRDFLRAWWPRFTPMRVLRWLAEPARLRAYANGVLSREEIATLQGSFDGSRRARSDDRRRGAAGRAGRADGPPAAAGQEEQATRSTSATACRRSARTPTARRRPARSRCSATTTTATTRTWWSTRRRTCRRCSGG